MIAERLIETAKAAGLSIEVDGPDLIVEADHSPPDELIAELRVHKAEVIAFLLPRPAAAPSRPEDHQSEALGEPVLLRDGRRVHCFRTADASAARPRDAANLVDRARFRGAVLVADGRELIVVEPWLTTLPEEMLRDLKDNASSVIAILFGESRARTRAAERG